MKGVDKRTTETLKKICDQSENVFGSHCFNLYEINIVNIVHALNILDETLAGYRTPPLQITNILQGYDMEQTPKGSMSAPVLIFPKIFSLKKDLQINCPTELESDFHRSINPQ